MKAKKTFAKAACAMLATAEPQPFASIRVQAQCMATGQAAGVAAAMAAKQATRPTSGRDKRVPPVADENLSCPKFALAFRGGIWYHIGVLGWEALKW